MSYTKKYTYYFDAPGPDNTDDCISIAIQRAKEIGISTILVASTSGETVRIAHAAMKGSGLRLVVVSHVVGFSKSGEWEFDTGIADDLQAAGVQIVTGTHALSGLERALSHSQRVGGGSRTEAIAEALRRVVATGLKVAVECTLIATDQGVIAPPEEVVAIGGTASGADTVCVIRPAHTASFFDLQVREIVAMPRVR